MDALKKAKDNYKEDTGARRVKVKPYHLRGIGESKTIFMVNGKKHVMSQSEYNAVFIPL